jgi:O-antigen/teichoic acid export membrane protein
LSSDGKGLKQRVLSSAKWTLAGHGAGQVLKFGSNLILTRLLAPDMFGVMALGYMVFTGLTMLSDLGIGDIVARSRRGDEPKFLNVLWVMESARGILIAVCALGLGVLWTVPWVRALIPTNSVYGDPRIPGLIATLALVPLIAGFESTKSFLARRQLSIATLTKVDLACQFGSTVATLCWAFFDASVWALAFGWVFGGLMKTVLSHAVLPGPRNRFEWDTAAFWEAFNFGKWAMISSPVSFLLMSGDRILLSGFLNATTMGFYSIGFLLVTALQSAIGRVVFFSVLPALSEVHRDRPAELRATIYRIRRPLDVACIVPAGMLFVLGDVVVRILYDSRYLPAGWMLSVVALTLAFVQFNVFDQALMAVGRIRTLTALNVMRTVVLFGVIWLGHHFFGDRGAVIGVPCAALVNASVLMAVNSKLGFVDMRRELLGIPLFAAGAGLGWLVKVLAHWLLGITG